MARKVQEESSSSQNVKRNIQRISERGSAVEIILSDSSPFFIMPEDFACLEISEGEDISPDEYEKLEILDEKRRAVKKSLDLISISSQTEYLLKIKLMKRDYSSVSISAALEYLHSRNLINDREYAEQWLISRLKKNPSGPYLLKGLLSGKGVARDISESVVDSFFTEDVMEEAISRQVEKLQRKKDITKDKIISRLLSKGFSMKDIRKHFSNNLLIFL